MDPLVPLAGFALGILTGLAGVGGGALLTPVLILGFGVAPSIAVGTDLLATAPAKAVAAWTHLRAGTPDRRLVRALALGAIPGALLGLAALALVRMRWGPAADEPLLRHAIGVAILLAAAASAVLWLLPRPAPGTRPARPPALAAVIAGGVVVGALVAMTSIGSGSLTLPLLLIAARGLPLRALIGAEIVVAALVVPLAAAGHLASAHANAGTAAGLALGALPGAYLGARWCARVDERALRPAVIGLLAYAGARLL